MGPIKVTSPFFAGFLLGCPLWPSEVVADFSPPPFGWWGKGEQGVLFDDRPT